MELASRYQANTPEVARRKDTTRSRMTNGTKLLSGVDGRTLWVKRFRDVLNGHIADLGGESNISVAERSIVRRAATLTVELERMERTFALAGEASAEDLDIYARVAANMRRLLESVGLQRRSRDVCLPSIEQYLNHQTIDEASE